MKIKDELNHLSGAIINSAMEVHREFGPGLLERVYEAALQREPLFRGISSRRQVQTEVFYKGEILDEDAYPIDLLVEECVVVEIKTAAAIVPIHETQLHLHAPLAEKARPIDQLQRYPPPRRHQTPRHQFPAITPQRSLRPPRFASSK